MPVTGIGGFVFRSENPKALAAWYRQHFGIGGYEWRQNAGRTVFMPFARTTDYFPADKHWALTLRVDDLDAVVAELAAAGIATTKDPAWDTPETGRFARLFDPEGNQIELWEPPVE